MTEKSFVAGDGKEMYYRVWQAQNEKKVLQLVHGASEHSGRYDEFARWLNKRNISVYALDNRGHGLNSEGLGFVHIDSDKWFRLVEDPLELGKIISETTGKRPYLLGHSMGSFIARTMALEGGKYEKFFFTGTGWQSPAMLASSKLLVNLLIKIYGELRPDKMIDKMSFGQYRSIMIKKGFADNSYGWLTRDEEKQAEAMKEDALKELFSLGAFLSLLNLVEASQDPKGLNNVQAPVHFLSGDRDPVGDFGKGPKKAYELFRVAPFRAHLEIYEGMHHEILNDTERLKVYDYIYYHMQK